MLINPNPPCRPPFCEYNSVAELYQHFRTMFLPGDGKHNSSCGHVVHLRDHHFFHLVSLWKDGPPDTLSMRVEREEIMRTNEGSGAYTIENGESRAKNLPSAKMAILEPDEVWEDNPKTKSAKWVYIKQFDSRPYPYTICLLKPWEEENGIIILLSAFPCKRNRIRAWRQGTRIYPKQIQPPEGG